MLIQDLVLRIFGVEYHPHYLCTLLDQMGFRFKRFISDHWNAAARGVGTADLAGIVRLAQAKDAMISLAMKRVSPSGAP